MSFAVLRLFCKICKVLQIRVFASFRKYNFCKVSQIGFSFRKVLQVSHSLAMGSLLMSVEMRCQCLFKVQAVLTPLCTRVECNLQRF